MKLPADHTRRFELHNEVHARPPEPLATPSRLTFIAVVVDPAKREAETRHIEGLCRRFGVGGPSAEATHFTGDLGPFRLRWERHSEFSRYMFFAPGQADDPFRVAVAEALPADWIDGLPGETIVAAHAAIIAHKGNGDIDHEATAKRHFAGNTLIGSEIAGGAGIVLTDLKIHADGMSRFLVLNMGLAPRATGRMMQRLLEIETYRMMALLALPVARELGPFLTECERELGDIAAAMVDADVATEPVLLERLTRLEAEIERRYAETQYRFSAAAAYYDLVRSRIEELREDRIEGLQMFREFMARRLTPAMNTCRATARRLEAVSARVDRSSQMLSTRVNITREKQNQALLQTMSHRAQLQLRLQQTVEGLSVAAITYYIVGLVGYAAKGAKAFLPRVEPDVVMAVSIPAIIAIVVLILRRVKRGFGE